MTDQPPSFMAVHRARLAVARRACTLASSTRADYEWRNRFCTMPIDALRTAYTQHEHRFSLKQAQTQTMKQSRLTELVYGMLTERQLARQSLVTGLR